MERFIQLSDLRRMLTGSPARARSRRWFLPALVLVMLAQAMALDHLLAHSARGDNAGCVICVSAGHAGKALPASVPDITLPKLVERPASPFTTGQVCHSPPAVYRSRAPPALT